MKRNSVFSRILILCAAVLMLFGTGCTGVRQDSELAALTQTLINERNDLQNKLTQAEQQIDTLQGDVTAAKEAAKQAEEAARIAEEKAGTASEPTIVTETKEVVTEIPANYAIGIDCTIDGERIFKLSDKEASVLCKADEKDGYVFDHWVIGDQVDTASGPEATFTLTGSTAVQAVYHQRRVVTTINCHLQFLNEKNNAKGANYTEFDFEEDYVNPVTKAKCAGGKISFYLTADIPKHKEVDYWLVNGVKYQYANNVTKFRVEELDENTVYEVVFKGETKTEKKETPTTYYTVTCHSCTFSGGGVSGSSGKVPAGTTITVTGTSSSSDAWFDATPSSNGMGSYGSPLSSYKSVKPASGSGYWTYYFQYTVTINSDTEIWFRAVIN